MSGSAKFVKNTRIDTLVCALRKLPSYIWMKVLSEMVKASGGSNWWAPRFIARSLSLPLDQGRPDPKKTLNEKQTLYRKEWTESTYNVPNCLSLPKSYRVRMIHTVQDLHLFANDIMNERILGWDTEGEPMKTIQVSGESTGYWLDVASLELASKLNPDHKSFISYFFNELFASKSIAHIFFASQGDVNILSKTFGLSVVNLGSIVDVQEVMSMLITSSSGTSTSLATVAQTFLGATLSKTCQVSDWEMRPLVGDQVHYAMLDAYVTRLVFISLSHALIVDKSKLLKNSLNTNVKWPQYIMGQKLLAAVEMVHDIIVSYQADK